MSQQLGGPHPRAEDLGPSERARIITSSLAPGSSTSFVTWSVHIEHVIESPRRDDDSLPDADVRESTT